MFWPRPRHDVNRPTERPTLFEGVYKTEEKKEEIWLSPMTKTPTSTEKSKKQLNNTKMPPKISITRRLRTDLGNNHLIFMGGGRKTYVSRRIFFAYFWSRRIFFAGPSGRIIFFKPPETHFIKPWGEGGGGCSAELNTSFSWCEQYFPK